MRIFYIFLFLCFFSLPSFGDDYSCVDKKYSRLSKMSIKDDALTFINERGKVQEYKIIDNSQKSLGERILIVSNSPNIETNKYGNIYNVKFMEAISSNTVKDLKRVYYLFEGTYE